MIKLYRKRSDGIIATKELARSMFPDEDAFNEALDFFYAEGFTDNYEEAQAQVV